MRGNLLGAPATCQNLQNFVKDGTANAYTYTATDGVQQMGCKCDAVIIREEK